MKEIDYNALAMKGLDEMYKTKSFSHKSMALCGVVSEDGVVYLSSNQACHAGMDARYDADFPAKRPVGISAIQYARDDLEPEARCRKFINWLVNESKAYSHLFIIKDVDIIWEKKGFALYTNVPSNLMVGAMILTRILWEYTNILRTWEKLYDKGVNGDAAIMLAHAFLVKGNTVTTSYNSGHCALSASYCNKGTIKRLMTGTLNSPKENYDVNCNYNGGVHNCYGNGDALYDDILKMCENKGVVEGIYNNPFAQTMNKRRQEGEGKPAHLDVFVETINNWLGA